jgi:HK97 family phage major capsid protein
MIFPMSDFLARLTEARDKLLVEAQAIMALATTEDRDVTPEEDTRLGELKTDLERRSTKIAEAEAFEVEVAKAAEARVQHAVVLARPRIEPGPSEAIYRPENREFSYFRDIYLATMVADADAAGRLNRHNRLMVDLHPEYRDGTFANTSIGAFIPTVFMIDEYAALARAGRPAANLIRNPGPPPSDTVTVPRITTGATTAAQTENAAVSETDIVTAELTRTTVTVAGQQDTSIQSIELGSYPKDQIIFADLLADYNEQVDDQVLNGSGTAPNSLGIRNVVGINAVTYTDATPTAAELYKKLANAQERVHSLRFSPADAWVMHPRRWAFLLSESDTTNRPLVTPYAAQNAIGSVAGNRAEGLVGEILGVPVYADANIPTNLGAGTNEDTILCVKAADMLLFEGAVRTRVLSEVLSGNLTLRFQLFAYHTLFAGRYPAGISAITGTGLITPVF